MSLSIESTDRVSNEGKIPSLKGVRSCLPGHRCQGIEPCRGWKVPMKQHFFIQFLSVTRRSSGTQPRSTLPRSRDS